jgi:hypothetical protein
MTHSRRHFQADSTGTRTAGPLRNEPKKTSAVFIATALNDIDSRVHASPHGYIRGMNGNGQVHD